LRQADLRGAQLRRACLIDVDLTEANLQNARFNGADLTDVKLVGANLRDAHFAETKLRGATLAHTFLADCRNLHHVVGLTEVKHAGPTSLDVRTLRESVIHLPEAFLRAVGYTAREIHNLRAFYAE
jgi:uncharacterized protein YjbI with pentapeptide repeats